MNELIALANGIVMGKLRQIKDGRLQFSYDETWQAAPESYPLSLSMPSVLTDHADEVVRPFLAGLLPDNEHVLEQWGRRFGVSPRNPFALLRYVGEECAGAVQFVIPERVAHLQGSVRREITWLTHAQVAERLRMLRTDSAAWQAPRGQGQFSLAGAQPKIALLLGHGRWGVPKGRTPTTHILKPPTGAYDGFAENEHFCLRLAQAIALPAAQSTISQFEDQLAIVVTRYDRMVTRAGVTRIHQEDFCQALSVPPARKYQSEGGPGVANLVDVIRNYSSTASVDLETFVRSLAFHWIVGAPDAHAKNYSLLLGGRATVRLAPLYDIVTALPYPTFDHGRLELAMQIGGESRMNRIGPRHWRKLARTVALDEEHVLEHVHTVARQISEVVYPLQHEMLGAGITHPIVPKIAALIAGRAQQCGIL